MRKTEIRCDACGKSWEAKRQEDEQWLRQRAVLTPQGQLVRVGQVTFRPDRLRLDAPLFWWTSEEAGLAPRTGMMDFCSHRCLAEWARDDRVLQTFAEDYR